MVGSKKTIVVLREVKELLRSSERWTKGTMALTDENKPCDPLNEKAARYCLVGAVAKVSGTHAYFPLVLEYTKPRGCALVSTANDIITHAELMNWLDRAIDMELHGRRDR